MVPTPSVAMAAMAVVVAMMVMAVVVVEMRRSMVVPVGVAAFPAIQRRSQIGAAGVIAPWPRMRAGHRGGDKQQGNGFEKPMHGAISRWAARPAWRSPVCPSWRLQDSARAGFGLDLTHRGPPGFAHAAARHCQCRHAG